MPEQDGRGGAFYGPLSSPVLWPVGSVLLPLYYGHNHFASCYESQLAWSCGAGGRCLCSTAEYISIEFLWAIPNQLGAYSNVSIHTDWLWYRDQHLRALNSTDRVQAGPRVVFQTGVLHVTEVVSPHHRSYHAGQPIDAAHPEA